MNMEHSIHFLYSAMRSAEESVRGYDTKAQIVGIGYIFTTGIMLTIGALNPDKLSFSPWNIVLAWAIIISPIVFFGMVLYPSKRTAPSLDERHTDIKRLYYSDSSHYRDIDTFLSELESADIKKELAYDLMKLTALRDLKRLRFLKALWASAASLIVVMIFQVYRAFG